MILILVHILKFDEDYFCSDMLFIVNNSCKCQTKWHFYQFSQHMGALQASIIDLIGTPLKWEPKFKSSSQSSRITQIMSQTMAQVIVSVMQPLPEPQHKSVKMDSRILQKNHVSLFSCLTFFQLFRSHNLFFLYVDQSTHFYSFVVKFNIRRPTKPKNSKNAEQTIKNWHIILLPRFNSITVRGVRRA